MSESDVDYIIETSDEPLRFGTGRRISDDEMDITPMIDITFLLLIYFLVAPRLSEESMLQLPTARFGTGVSNKQSAIVTVVPGAGDDALIYKGEGKRAENLLAASSYDEQRSELETYFEQQLSTGGKQNVLIKAEKGVKHRDVAKVAKAVSSVSTDTDVHVLYVAVLEEQ